LTEPSLAAQRAAVTALRNSVAVTALCPAANIFDRSQRPEVFPCIVLGTATTTDESGDTFTQAEVVADVDVWTRENGFAACKALAGAVVAALRDLDVEQDGATVAFMDAASTFLRDPDGEHSHGALKITFTVDGGA
jgi:hypothetical protein